MTSRREIALIIDAGKHYDRQIVRGIAAYARDADQDWSFYVEEDTRRILPDLSTWAGDGIIANFDDRRVARAVSEVDIPVVGIGGGYGHYDPNTGLPFVRTDNGAIGRLAAEHLLHLGFRRFAFCGEPPNRFNGWQQERAEAFTRRVQEAGFGCEKYAGRHTAARHWREMQAKLQDWLASLAPPVGLMASYDIRARHVLEACRTLGLRVPEDVAILGVDNDDIMCELATPPLTSIKQGTRRIGYEAASVLDDMLRGDEPPRLMTTVAPEGLVARRSTDIVAIEDADVTAALQLIRQRACEPIRVQQVVDKALVSRSTLEARFHQYLGRSIHEEIRRLQIERARQLLSSTNLPIKQVAQRIGIPSVQYFTVAFRRATGQTPGQFRRQNR